MCGGQPEAAEDPQSVPTTAKSCEYGEEARGRAPKSMAQSSATLALERA